jgi:hypothetical protein
VEVKKETIQRIHSANGGKAIDQFNSKTDSKERVPTTLKLPLML